MKKVLVTGAAGFIASEVCRQLGQQGIEIVAIDNMNDYYDVRLKEYRLKQIEKIPNLVFSKVDIENKNALASLFESNQFDTVFNLAARAGVRYSMENPDIYMSTNAQGSLNLMNLMVKHKVKKFVLASTSSLYAGQKMPFSETLAVNTPISPYAASKKAAEVMAYSYHYLYNLDVSIVRYFTVFGPAGRPDMSIFRFIKWIDQNEKLELFGDGAQSRDFTFVEDIARGTILAAIDIGYEIINLGGGKNPISMNTVIGEIEKLLGKKANIDEQKFHIADIKETWADISKAESLLGWKPQVNFSEGLSRTIQWYNQNRSWLKDITL